mmetsp:Transcript_27203/g.73089  ORF Transcript_27203/g.73089 Transcript_27203/m.73089 type:complete len:287 (+) Transcript_27203:296-1156(+)
MPMPEDTQPPAQTDLQGPATQAAAQSAQQRGPREAHPPQRRARVGHTLCDRLACPSSRPSMPAKRSGIEALRFTSSLTLSCTRIGSTAPRQRTPLCLLSNAHGRARREDEKRRSTGGSLYASVAKLCSSEPESLIDSLSSSSLQPRPGRRPTPPPAEPPAPTKPPPSAAERATSSTAAAVSGSAARPPGLAGVTGTSSAPSKSGKGKHSGMVGGGGGGGGVGALTIVLTRGRADGFGLAFGARARTWASEVWTSACSAQSVSVGSASSSTSPSSDSTPASASMRTI